MTQKGERLVVTVSTTITQPAAEGMGPVYRTRHIHTLESASTLADELRRKYLRPEGIPFTDGTRDGSEDLTSRKFTDVFRGNRSHIP
jgi:hypothetical protein